MIVYGGASGGGELSSETLYLLNMNSIKGEGKPTWQIINTTGPNPGKRYGHTISYTKPYIIVFGGYSDAETLNDTWILNSTKSPFQWEKPSIKKPIPEARLYHSAALCNTGMANGMIVIFGGRGSDQLPRDDTWGLRKHRNGSWEWVRAPYKGTKTPAARYQHCAIFTNSIMLVIGGRNDNVGEQLGMLSYDTETLSWTDVCQFKMFRHSIWMHEMTLYSFGGFSHVSPDNANNEFVKIDLSKILKYSSEMPSFPSDSEKTGTNSPQFVQPNTNSPKHSTENSPNVCSRHDESVDSSSESKVPEKKVPLPPLLPPVAKFRMSQTAVIGMCYSPDMPVEIQKVVRMFTIDRLPEESKKLAPANRPIAPPPLTYSSKPEVVIPFLNQLLKPKDWLVPPTERKFLFKPEKICELARECLKVIEAQPMVITVKSPVKIFGDIHGQYHDMMRFFDLWRGPTETSNGGDIDSYDYLFLGDYVDRGSHSLETICLLMALKIKYPHQIHLLRGNHEDKWINVAFGFSEECTERLNENPESPTSVFHTINTVFDYLPLAAVIDGKILCLHGGIGSSVNTIDDIRRLPRPLDVIHEVSTPEQQMVVDILWSDPTENDEETGVHVNTIRDPGSTGSITRYGPDRVEQFLKQNNLKMIIRGHECVMDGFERFAKGNLITVFSATDYCGRYKNAGAILVLQKNFEIVPKLIFPVDNGGDVEKTNWIEDEKRPPTPPRTPSANNSNPS